MFFFSVFLTRRLADLVFFGFLTVLGCFLTGFFFFFGTVFFAAVVVGVERNLANASEHGLYVGCRIPVTPLPDIAFASLNDYNARKK